MAKYTIQHSCGHEETRQLYGKTSDRERKIAWLEDQPCSECYQKQLAEERQAENKAAADENKAAGLPELQGSKKQIPWAETIRKKFVKKLLEIQSRCEIEIEKYHNDKEFATTADRRFMKIDPSRLPLGCTSAVDADMAMIRAAQHIMTELKSSWWIDHRNDYAHIVLVKVAGELDDKIEVDEKSVDALEAKAEATIMPPETVSGTPAEITIEDNAVFICYPIKNRDFWEIVKRKLGFSWSGPKWELQIGVTNGSAVDRAAEAGHRLVAAGFPVILWDGEAREKAIAGTYQPRHSRWITTPVDVKEFRVRWSRGEDFYHESRQIAGSYYERPYVYVPATEYKEVLDFAEQFDFRLSPGAQKLVAEQERLLAGVKIVDPPPVQEANQVDKSRKDLNAADVTGDIDADLRDD